MGNCEILAKFSRKFICQSIDLKKKLKTNVSFDKVRPERSLKAT